MYAVNVFPGPFGRSALEAGVVEQNPVVQINRVFERTAVEIDHLFDRKTQEMGQDDHR